jgi:uncharacterized membrane protein YfcA
MVGDIAWWVWPLALFAVTFALGILAVLAGVGGGVLFVPIVGGFFPFHIDFVRGAGLLIALSGALSAAPGLLRGGFSSLRLAVPLGLVGSVTSIGGALLGLALPERLIHLALGATILCIAALMWRQARPSHASGVAPDALARALAMHGVYHDPATGRDVEWRVGRTPQAFVLFAGIGVLAGMFGLGAGWANVPVLHLVMGAPLKLSIGTSGLILSVVDSSAAWIYINRGAVLPTLVAPSLIGVILGAKVGARLLRIAHVGMLRRAVVALLLFAGMRALLKGLEAWF